MRDSPPEPIRVVKDARVCIVTVWVAADEPLAFRAAVRPVEERDAMLFTDASALAGYFAGLRRVDASAARRDADGPGAERGRSARDP